MEKIKTMLLEMLWNLKRQGKKIVVYGAGGGMTNTLLNYLGLNQDLIDYAVDINRLKQGLFLPKSRIGIYSPEKLMENNPDYVLITAWNYVDEIIQQQSAYRERGGKFILPLPKPRIL